MNRVPPRTQRTSSKATVAFARELRRRATVAEVVLWEMLRSRRLDGHKFRRQHPIGPFIADFFCAEAGLVIELDGGIHDELDQRDRDRLRDFAVRDHGLRVLRVRNEELTADPAGVQGRIRELLCQ